MKKANSRTKTRTQVTKVNDSGTVTVACKVPNGIVLRLHRLVDVIEATPDGGRKVKMAQQYGNEYTVHGPARPFGQAPRTTVVGGYALTKGVPADFWNEWLRQNAHSDLVRNNQIHAYHTLDAVKGEAQEKAKVRSGMEPIVPDKDPRIPKRIKSADRDKMDSDDEVETAHA